MKTLYLECNMGAAGDMLMAALLELLPDKTAFIDEMNSLGIPGVRVSANRCEKSGIVGTSMSVLINGEEEENSETVGDEHGHEHEHEHGHGHGHGHGRGHTHSHSDSGSVSHIIEGLPVSERVRGDALAVYGLISEAESHVHDRPAEMVHFHEVGSMDAIADIVGVCLLMEKLAPDRVLASPIHVGCGQIRCAHGILPVPAPATAYILRGVPIYGGEIKGELCTPTGAALLKHFAEGFGAMPVMSVSATGYGMGKKEFEAVSCVRAHIGDAGDKKVGSVAWLSCNLDDMTPEATGFALETLLEAGALDAFTSPIGMKKSRPGVMLSCVCRPEKAGEMARLMLRHTTTLGVRQCLCQRYELEREKTAVQTKYGPIGVKTARGYGVTKRKAEYEDAARAARENGVSLFEILDEI